jgi:hypothetical protein
MKVNVQKTNEDGVVVRFNVSGLPTYKSLVDLDGSTAELELTLNGDYYITPGKCYSMLPAIGTDLPRPDGVDSLAYQVILMRHPPSAEFQVFQLSESPAITESQLSKLNITRDTFMKLTTEQPAKILNYLDTSMLPNGVAKFLLQAKKCTSN